MKKLISLLAALLWLTGCGDVQNEYSNFRPYFMFENNVHQNPRLAEAMTPHSGMFCTVRLQNTSGVLCYVFTNSNGQTKETLLNDRDKQRTRVLGINNGLIVGYGNLNDPPTFYAYDLECPNCFNPDVFPLKSKPLQLASGGIADCNVCKRRYNLNAGGLVISGERGKPLTRYRAQTTGPYGTLTVN